MAKNREFVATFIRERNAFENGNPDDPDYRRTIIASVEDSDGCDATIKGDALPKQLQEGVTYRFYGHPSTHHKWGEQFLFTSFVVEEPATEAGVVAYLSQLNRDALDPTGEKRLSKGIGKGTAHLLWEEYGSNAVSKLRDEPAVVADDIRLMSLAVAEAASAWLTRNQALERCKIDLIGLLNGRGCPKKTIDFAIARYGSKAADLLRGNPYLLMQFKGCGFSVADKLYLDLGYRPDRLKRQSLCIWHTISRDSEGNTWHPLAKVEAAVRAGVAGSKVKPEKALQLALRAGMLAIHTDVNGQKWIAEARKAENEARIAEHVLLAKGEEFLWPDVDALNISEHQAVELAKALQGTICCLAGSPGTGKTYVAAALINAIVREHGSESIAVCAPTGKASVRLTQSLQEYGTGIEATTTHRLLKVDMAGSDGWSFLHDEENPLPFRFVLIDESSMIDTDLMSSLLAARAPGTHYLFIGDHRQLAPVGHGCPFFDLQRADVPTGELIEVQRNSGQIVKACSQIREDHRFDTSGRIAPDEGENLYCWQMNEPDKQINALAEFYRQIGEDGDVDTVWDVQVLVAVNKKSPLSRKVLNENLQGLLNPTGRQCKGNPFRIGDKIINLKNGKFPCDDPGDGEADKDGNVFVANGEQAEVLQVEPARTIARLQSPERVIVIPHGQQKESEEGEDSQGSAGSWDLAYAISTHKSQGSEWPLVILMIDEYAGAKRLCTRNWIYTAISRAKRLCLMIGRNSTAQKMARRDGLKRKTFLAERIRGEKYVEPVIEQPEVVRISELEFRSLFMSNV